MTEHLAFPAEPGGPLGELYAAYLNAQSRADTDIPGDEQIVAAVDPVETTAAEVDVTSNDGGIAHADVVHETSSVQPDKNDVAANTAPKTFLQKQAEQAKTIRHSLAVSFAGFLGLAGCGLAVINDPRVATTFLQHTERFSVEVLCATLGWSSVAASVGGLFFAYSAYADKRDERKAYRNSL